MTIEAYDFDALRDSGIHWRYLQFAFQDHEVELTLEPDPFAAELLVEGIAQYGVLALRLTGKTAKKKGDSRLNVEHLKESLQEIRRRVALHAKAKPLSKPTDTLASSDNVTRVAAGTTYFTDVTEASGVRFVHRSSDGSAVCCAAT